jgi:CRISPR-associated protein Cas5h
VFDIGSSFGYFRKAFTTTSALTHSVIPRSAIEGLIGAILGYSSGHYPDRLQSSKIAVQIISPVRKMNMKYMHTNPDWWQNVSHYLEGKTISKYIQFAVPASVEFLVNPRYRVYIDSGDFAFVIFCKLSM